MSLNKYLLEAQLAAVQPVTGDEFDISIRELANVETRVVEHTEGSITIALDEKAIKMLEECGCTFEEERIDELAPLVAVPLAIGGALARGAVAGAGALAKGAARAAVGTGVKAVGSALDKKLFGPKPHEGDYDESVREQDEDEDEIEYQPQTGDIVQIDYPTAHEGQYGEVVELSPSGDFVYVEFKDGNIESYHSSDLRQATEDEIDQYHNNDEEYEENLNDIKRLSGMKQEDLAGQSIKLGDKVKTNDAEGRISKLNIGRLYADDEIEVKTNKGTVKGGLEKFSKVDEAEHDKTHGSPYDRGAADAYYGRKARPHKMMPVTDGVEGQMKMVPLTDPAEIAAYTAGYSENDDRKDYGEGIENWQAQISSIPRTEPFKLKKIVVTSPKGKVYTFDTEEDARRLFLDKWHVVKDPSSGWTVDMKNTKSEIGLDEAEYQVNEISQDAAEIRQHLDSVNEGRFEEPLLGYRIVSKKSGQVHPGKFASKDAAQKHLMTKMFANHQDYEVKSFDESVNEAEYQGRDVPLSKPMRGDVKKFKVYVKDPKTGNVKKVNFGDPDMRIKKSNPARRKSFRARHRCDTPGPKTKARYWSCKAW